MLRWVRDAIWLVLGALAAPAGAQPLFGLEAGKHAVGFRLLEDEDHSRAVTGGTRGIAHARPIRTYLWYPAAAPRRSQPMRFGRYAELADDDIWPAEIAGEVRDQLKYSNGPLARSLPASSYAALLERPMHAVENAEPLDGPFPLIVIGLGLYYESPIALATTAEYLAGRGFAVATTPLAGTHVPIIKLDTEDLETQVRDLEFVIARARQYSFVDREQLGVLGFDMGGMVGVVLAMRNRDVDAFVSLDSGIQYRHPSTLPRSSPHYDALALRVPWLHAATTRNDGPPTDAPSLFDEAVHSDRYWIKVESMGHADFTSYALVEDRGEAPGYWAAVTPERAAAHRVVADYVRHFFAAYLTASDVSFSLLDQAVRQPHSDAGFSLEHRSATQPPLGYDELVRKVIGGRADEAVAGLRSLAATSPEHPMLSEFNLERLGMSLVYTWNLAERTLPLVAFAAERYPTSPNVKALLGETQAMLGNYPAAIAAFEDLLAQFPGNPAIQARLDTLHTQR